MKQVKLQQGDNYMNTWIDSYAAKVNMTMTIDGKGLEGRWTVIEVYPYEVSPEVLKQYQKNTRHIFGSIL